MLVTVAICTYNRAQLLDSTLTRLHELRIPSGIDWELLIVNNNCTDGTDEVIARHSPRLPIRRHFESKQGIAHARNCAARAAKGELLLWTDDDVLVDPDWLTEYVKAANDWPDAAFFGGTIDPWFVSPQPRWLRKNHDRIAMIFPTKQLGERIFPLPADERLLCANMALRTSLFQRYSYDTRMDRRLAGFSNFSAACEDHELIDRLRQDGHRGVWVGPARVKHYVAPERMTKNFARVWWREQAKLYAIRFPMAPCPLLWGVPRWMWLRYWKARTRSWCFSLFQGPRWAKAFLETAWLEGLIEHAREHGVSNNNSTREVGTIPCER